MKPAKKLKLENFWTKGEEVRGKTKVEFEKLIKHIEFLDTIILRYLLGLKRPSLKEKTRKKKGNWLALQGKIKRRHFLKVKHRDYLKIMEKVKAKEKDYSWDRGNLRQKGDRRQGEWMIEKIFVNKKWKCAKFLPLLMPC